MSDPIRVVQFSGGKDSTALVLWAREQWGEAFTPVFCDTGWEHALTLGYIGYINHKLLGGRLVVVRCETYERYAPSAGAMIQMITKKQSIPSARRRFCTEDLKVKPFIAWIKAQDFVDTPTVYQGIRAEESAARAAMPMRVWNDDFDAWIERPLHRWSADQVFEIHRRYEVDPNPLYLLGSARVGCFPCIMVNKSELRRLTRTLPEIWDRMREMERAAGRGRRFFAADYIPHEMQTGWDAEYSVRFPTVDDVRHYVLDDRQSGLFDDEPQPRCMSVYNLCE